MNCMHTHETPNYADAPFDKHATRMRGVAMLFCCNDRQKHITNGKQTSMLATNDTRQHGSAV